MTEPSRALVEALWDAAKASRAKRAEDMPDEETCLRRLFDAVERMKELGWRDAVYAPKSAPLLLIEPGCTAVLRGYRDSVGFWVTTDDDTYPSHPILFMDRAAAELASESASPPTSGSSTTTKQGE